MFILHLANVAFFHKAMEAKSATHIEIKMASAIGGFSCSGPEPAVRSRYQDYLAKTCPKTGRTYWMQKMAQMFTQAYLYQKRCHPNDLNPVHEINASGQYENRSKFTSAFNPKTGKIQKDSYLFEGTSSFAIDRADHDFQQNMS